MKAEQCHNCKYFFIDKTNHEAHCACPGKEGNVSECNYCEKHIAFFAKISLKIQEQIDSFIDNTNNLSGSTPAFS